MLRKRGKMIVGIATISGRHHPNTIHLWLHRLEREGPGGRYDRWGPGRPRRLTLEQEQPIKVDLGKPPSDSGFMRGGWNARMPAKRVVDKFGVIPCSRRTALRIADRLGFSTRKPRSMPYNSAAPEEQAAFIEEARGAITRWNEEGRIVLAIDAATMWDSPTSGRGLRRRGGKEHSPHQPFQKVNPPDRGFGGGTPDLPFHDDLKADGHAALV